MNRMKELREKIRITMTEAAKRLNMPYTTYVNYEKGLREPDSETLIQIANFYETTIDYLLCRSNQAVPVAENIMPMPTMRKIPLLGTIACGEPILATENLDGEVDIPEDVHADFSLRCKGDSMINARIFDGDIVYIRQQETVENGEIAAVLIGDEATLKRVHMYDTHIVLSPENPLYPAKTYHGEEMNAIRILGKAVAFTSTVR